MFNYMMITNDPKEAKIAETCGVSIIFVDLEINGKQERQGHRNTFISTHKMSDISRIKRSLTKAELLVRLNPLHDGSKEEIEQAIINGADILMLPMFRTALEVSVFSEYIGGRVKFIPLIETKDATLNIKDIVKVKGITELFIGLNDLHMEYGYDFMFELVSEGIIDEIVKPIKKANLSFGFGGVACVGEGAIPAEYVLSEHLRLGSNSVILSRDFRKNGLEEGVFLLELNKLENSINKSMLRTEEDINKDQVDFKMKVREFVLDRKNSGMLFGSNALPVGSNVEELSVDVKF